MHGLKIINSQHSRIMTQCEHCQHVMKTTADTLYYLVECPRCFKDFVVRRFQEVESRAKVQVQKVRENISYHTPHQDEVFIKTIYNLSWPIYKTAIGL